jgi:hypothetical protein
MRLVLAAWACASAVRWNVTHVPGDEGIRAVHLMEAVYRAAGCAWAS